MAAAASSADIVSADPSSMPSMHAKMRPQEGDVFLDDLSGGQVLTNVRTLVQHKMDSNGVPWLLEFDENGYGALLSADEDRCILLEDFMQASIYDAPNGSVLVRSRVAEGSSFTMSNLTEKMTAFTTRIAKCISGGKSLDLVAYKVPWPRGSSRILWGALELYKLFDLASYKGIASKWVYESLDSWNKTMMQLELKGHIFKSTASVPRAGAMVALDVFTPTPAMTTIALLVLTTRWTHTARYGFRDSLCRRNALSFLEAFVATAHALPFVLEIGLRTDWMPRWPRPKMECNVTVTLPVDAAGFVDLKAFAELVANDSDGWTDSRLLAKQWWVKILGSPDKVRLVELLESDLAADPSFQGCWLQLVMQVATRIELVLYKADKGDIPLDALPIHLEALDEENGSWSCREVDKTIVRHVNSCAAACRGYIQYFGLAVDKANIRGQSLHNGFMVLPNNIAFELLPQVASRGKWVAYIILVLGEG
jgi:hypothetical protein